MVKNTSVPANYIPPQTKFAGGIKDSLYLSSVSMLSNGLCSKYVK